MTRIEQVDYQGWSNCYRLTNDLVELIITADVGPRIIHFSFVGEENVLYENQAHLGLMGGDEWRIYGGHRLWHTPEQRPRTYQPDNTNVDHFELDNVHYFVPSVEMATGIQKQISISFHNETVVVDHALTNMGLWTIETAPWALTVMKTGGIAVLPLPPHGSHDENLLPTHALTLWSYTKLNDPRLTFGDKYILVQQDTANDNPLKIGLNVQPELFWSVGWLGYINNNVMFAKSFHPPPDTEQHHPDKNTQVEIFTDHRFLELETLGQIHHLEPEDTAKHREYWSLHRDVSTPESDADIGEDLLTLVRSAHPMVGRKAVD